jgi:hypothetical protein
MKTTVQLTKSGRFSANDKTNGSKESEQLGGHEVTIRAPNFHIASFEIRGIAPLVIQRFRKKTQQQLRQKQETGKAASSKKSRDPQSMDALFNEARYISTDGWDGFNATSIRNALIEVCRLVGFKMILAKMSIFCIEDGWDKEEPQTPLCHILDAKAEKQEDMGRVQNGNPYVIIRARYNVGWRAIIRLRWDADQFTMEDVTHLLMRVGLQNGIGEGRPNSKESAGLNWGLFEVGESKQLSVRP